MSQPTNAKLRWSRGVVWVVLVCTMLWVMWVGAAVWGAARSGSTPPQVFEYAQAQMCQFVHRPWFFLPYMAFIGAWGFGLFLAWQRSEMRGRVWEIVVFIVTAIVISFHVVRCW